MPPLDVPRGTNSELGGPIDPERWGEYFGAGAEVPKKPPFELGGPIDPERWGEYFGAGAEETKLKIAASEPRKTSKEAAHLLNLQAKTGIPTGFIKENLEYIESQVGLKEFNASEWRSTSPHLAEWLAKHPEHYPLAKNDLDLMSNWEAFFRAISGGSRESSASSEVGLLGFRAMAGDLEKTDPRIAALEKELKQTPNGGGFTSWLQSGAYLVGQVREAIPEALPYAAAGFGVGALSGSLGGPASPVTVPAGALIGAGVGFKVGFAGYAFRVESGSAYLEMSKIRSSEGEPLDENVIRGASVLVGLANAGLELVSFSILTAPVKRAARTFLINGAKDLLRREGGAAALAQFARSYAAAVSAETITEMAQEVMNVLGEEVAKLASHGDFKTVMADPGQRAAAVDRILGIGEKVFKGMVVVGPIIPGVRAGAERAMANRAKAAGGTVAGMGEEIAATDTYKEMPSKIREVFQNLARDSNFYISPESWNEYFQTKGEDPREMAREVYGDTSAYDEASAAGHDMEIPAPLYAEKIAPTEHSRFFAREIRVDPEEMNEREADEFYARETAGREAEAPPVPDSAEQVKADVLSKLVGARYSPEEAETNAAMVASVFRSMGERAGVDPMELYRRYELDIRRPRLPEVLTRIRSAVPSAVQADLPAREREENLAYMNNLLDRARGEPTRAETRAERKARGPTLIEFLRKRGGMTDPGGDLAAMDVEKFRKPFQRRLINPAARDPAYAAEAAFEEGYIPERDINLLHEAIREELAGRPTYADVDVTADVVAAEAEAGMMRAEIDRAGIGRGEFLSMTNEEVIARLNEAYKGGRFEQPPAPAPASLLQRGVDAFRTFFQADKPDEPPRGRILIGAPDPLERTRGVIIELLERADLSTFLHETGHLYLTLLGDVTDELKGRAPESLTIDQRRMIEDRNTLFKWLGVETWEQIGTAQQQKFAFTFEAYFFEGKAPSIELRSAFARFKSWLFAVYRSIRGIAGASLNDEVRGVFDRMLATEAEIAAAEAEAEVQPIFLTAEDAGMTATEFDAYRKAVETESQRARESVELQAMGEFLRENKAWWRKRRAEVRAEVEAEVNDIPAYNAMLLLQGKKAIEGFPEGFRLDRAEIERLKGKEFLKELPKPTVHSAEGGLALDAAALLLGFDNGSHLLTELAGAAARPRVRLIEAETDLRMRQDHGDMLLDGSLHGVARQAVLGEGREKILRAELSALRKLERAVRPILREREVREREGRAELKASIPPLALIRRLARERILRTRVAALKPSIFMAAQRKASRRAREALLRKDYAAAAEAVQSELLNVSTYKEVMEARQDSLKIDKYMRGLQKTSARARIGKAGHGYLEQLDALMRRFDFSVQTIKETERRVALGKWVQQRRAEGVPVEIPEEIENEAYARPWKDLTYGELLGVRDAVRHIVHLARSENRLLKNEEFETLEAARDLAAETAYANARSIKPIPAERLPQSEIARRITGFPAANESLSSWMRILDGGKDGGPMWRMIQRPINDAKENQTLWRMEAGKALLKIWNDHYTATETARFYQTRGYPAFGASFTKRAVIMMALNWGNEDGRAKLVAGMEVTFDRSVSEEEAFAVIDDTMEPRDWKFAEDVWAYLDTFRPELFGLAERLTGLAPEKIEAAPFMTRHGEVKGGYFPLMYDTDQSRAASEQATRRQVERTMTGASARASTKAGARIERVSGVRRPVLLDFNVLNLHLEDVITDITMTETLIDVNRILRGPQVERAIKQTLGVKAYDHIIKLLDTIAGGEVQPGNDFERFARWTRKGTSVAYMAWNAMTIMVQPLGIIPAIPRVGVLHMAKSMSKWSQSVVGMDATFEWAEQQSKLLRTRGTNFERFQSELMDKIHPVGSVIVAEAGAKLHVPEAGIAGLIKLGRAMGPVADSFFWGIYQSQKIADRIVWLGAYEKFMAETKGDHGLSVSLADQMVRDTQGTGDPQDLSLIMQSGEMARTWTHFFTWFAAMYRLLSVDVRTTDFKDIRQIGRLAWRFAFTVSIAAVAEDLLRDAIMGRKDEPDETATGKMLKIHGMFLLNLMPGTRELSRALEGWPYKGPAGAAFWASLYDLVIQTGQWTIDEPFWRSLNRAGGIALRYPATLVDRLVRGFQALESGKSKNPAVLLTGPPPKK